MSRTATLILMAASAAALLLVASAGKSLWATDAAANQAAGGVSAAAGFAALVALVVFAAAMAEYLIHARLTYLCVATGFFAAAVMDAWSALVPLRQVGKPGADIALWYGASITLAAMLTCGAVAWHARTPRRRVGTSAAVFSAAAILWAAVIIYSASASSLGTAVSAAGNARGLGVLAAVLFAVAWVGYSRTTIHRSSAFLAWLAYGLVFAVFAQLAVVFSYGAAGGASLFGMANLMRILSYLAPLAGLLAEHTRLERLLERRSTELQGLVEMQRITGSAFDPGELYRTVVDLVASSFETDAVCLMPHDRGRDLLEVASTDLDEHTAKSLVFRAGDGPVGEALTNKEAVFVPDAGRDGKLGPKLGQAGRGRSAVCIPLLTPTRWGEEALGVLVALFRHGGPSKRHRRAKDQFRLLEAFASQAALAIARMQMRTRVQGSLRAHEARTPVFETLSKIGQTLASEMELHALVDALADHVRDAVSAQACAVLTYEPNTGGLKIMGHRKLRRHRETAGHVDECDAVIAMAAERGKPMSIANVPNSGDCKYPELAKNDEGSHHVLSVPMESRGQVIGAINVFRQDSDPFGEGEIRLLTVLAELVAVGIRNAELCEREKKIAESLHASLMSGLEQELPGLEATGIYKAGLDESSVGGDFFDIADLGEGRYGIAIGDVAGKGLDAAVYTAMAKHMVKAYSAEDSEPVSLVSRLNGALYVETPAAKFVTLIYGILDVNRGRFVYVNAGHELPFLYNKERGKLTRLETTGPALGAIPEVEYESDVVRFGPGDMLVFYTDGATGARKEGKCLQTEGLEKIVARQIRANPRNLAEAIYSKVREYASRHLHDDVVILCIKSVATPPAQ